MTGLGVPRNTCQNFLTCLTIQLLVMSQLTTEKFQDKKKIPVLNKGLLDLNAFSRIL